MSRKKQKALVVAHPALLGQGSSPCGVLASFQLPLQALPPHPIWDIVLPKDRCPGGVPLSQEPSCFTVPHLTQVPPQGVKEMEQASPLEAREDSSAFWAPTPIPVGQMSPLFSPGVGMGGPCGQGGRCCASESTPQSRVGRKALGSVCQECRLVGYKAGKMVGL